jgi:ATP-dependent Lon protease
VRDPGVATGLAWTPVGGDVLFIEVFGMPGAGKLIITGQLGDVMKESAQAALSWVRGHVTPPAENWFAENDIHIHVPAGAIPKDGPSAGVTMVTALTSLIEQRRVRADVAMTGEVTLHGEVLPIGGLKEKAIAAQRLGIRHVIAPELNEADIDEIPEQLREQLDFHFVSRVEEVLAIALEASRVASGPENGKPREQGEEWQRRPRRQRRRQVPRSPEPARTSSG